MSTAREIMHSGVECVSENATLEAAAERIATCTAGQLARGTPIWVDAGADEREVLRLMEEHGIRRLPVIDDHRLVGMISGLLRAAEPVRRVSA